MNILENILIVLYFIVAIILYIWILKEILPESKEKLWDILALLLYSLVWPMSLVVFLIIKFIIKLLTVEKRK